MKLVWCPETATKAYIDAVKALSDRELKGTDVAEMVSAMAGGWKAQLVVEAWTPGDGPATSVGLAAAVHHTRGRHVCVVPDQQSAAEYVEVMPRRAGAGVEAVVVGEAAAAMRELEGVELMVVDFRRSDAVRLLREARAGPRGMVVVCKNGGLPRGEAAMGLGTRVVRSAFLPIGRGVEILHVGVGKEPRLSHRGRWIRHVDRSTGEEHVFRR